jgi:shikimate dehydrogenase
VVGSAGYLDEERQFGPFMKVYGILGDPIDHSLSPVMHNAAFRAVKLPACYHAFRVSSERLGTALEGAQCLGFGGLNLTIPLKETALELVKPDRLAEAIGAVNTVSFAEGVRGYNTDGWGALMALERYGVKVRGRPVLLIGAGGAARAIAYTLEQEGAEITIANRNARRAEDLAGCVGAVGVGLEKLSSLVPRADIIINATSVGMKEGSRLFPGNLLRSGQVVFDIVYNRRTELQEDAVVAGAQVIDGVMMLVYQGARSFEIWTGKEAPVDVMEKAVRESLKVRFARRT